MEFFFFAKMFTLFKRLVYLPKHFVIYGHSLDHGVIDQFDMSMSGYNPSIDDAIKMSVVNCL